MQKRGVSPVQSCLSWAHRSARERIAPLTHPFSPALPSPLSSLSAPAVLQVWSNQVSQCLSARELSVWFSWLWKISLVFRLIIRMGIFVSLSPISWPSYLANFVLSTQHFFKLISKPALEFFLPMFVSLRKLRVYFPKPNNLVIWFPNTQVLKITVSSPWHFSV